MSEKKSKSDLSMIQLCRWAIGYAMRRWLLLGFVLATMLLKIGLDLLKPWPMVFLIDHVLQSKKMPATLQKIVSALPGAESQTSLIAWAVGATIIIFLLSWLLGVATAYANISFGQRMIYDLAADLFAKLQQLSLRFHTSKSVGDNIRRVTSDCSCVSTIVKDAILPLISSVVSLITMFLVLWRIDATLAMIAMAIAPYMGLIFFIYAKPMMEKSWQTQEIDGVNYEIVEQTLSAMPVVQAFSTEEQNEKRLKKNLDATLAATLSLTRTQLQFNFLMGLATTIGTASVLWIGAKHGLAGEMSIGIIVLFLSYLSSLYSPLESIMYTSAVVQGAAGSAKRVLEILETEREVKDRAGAKPLVITEPKIEFEDVTFGYQKDRPVLKNISLTVRPGEIIALVGATGAGKTTLAGLVPRFFDPWQGRVLINGHDVRDVQLKSLRPQIAVVLQEPFLFPLSLAANIAYARPNATREEIEGAARAANAHEFIQRFPKKYETVVGERGATLSGGERQRISIARALLKDAPILILDEPTSALDAETESSLMSALENLIRNRTTFIIAHRLSTIRRATKIIVLNEGRIEDTGTHDELLARGGRYADFYKLQVGSQKA